MGVQCHILAQLEVVGMIVSSLPPFLPNPFSLESLIPVEMMNQSLSIGDVTEQTVLTFHLTLKVPVTTIDALRPFETG